MIETIKARAREALADIAAGICFAFLLLILFTSPGNAADMAGPGGNCCADLEERIVELEATTARKGNRKVTVQIYGQVHQGILWHDIDGQPGANDASIGTWGPDATVVGVTGLARVNANAQVGYRVEVAFDGNFNNTLANEVRQANVWIDTKAGKVTAGFGDTASRGITEISLANTAVIARTLNAGALANIGFVVSPFDGARRSMVRFDTPTMGGFIASGSFANGDVWDLALRHSAELGGFRWAGGVSYRDDELGRWVVGSGSLKHITTGLFANVALGHGAFHVGADKLFGGHVQAGIERRWLELGATTLFVEYAALRPELAGNTPMLWGLGIVQHVQPAMMDVFLSYRRHDADVAGVPDANVVIGGARIRF